MLKRILLISAVISLAIAANGCEEEARTPQIVGNASHAFIEPTPPVYTPTPRPAKQDTFYNVPAAWIPPRAREKRWKAIVIHHSGTRSGNAAIFDDWLMRDLAFALPSRHIRGYKDMGLTGRGDTQNFIK